MFLLNSLSRGLTSLIRKVLHKYIENIQNVTIRPTFTSISISAYDVLLSPHALQALSLPISSFFIERLSCTLKPGLDIFSTSLSIEGVSVIIDPSLPINPPATSSQSDGISELVLGSLLSASVNLSKIRVIIGDFVLSLDELSFKGNTMPVKSRVSIVSHDVFVKNFLFYNSISNKVVLQIEMLQLHLSHLSKSLLVNSSKISFDLDDVMWGLISNDLIDPMSKMLEIFQSNPVENENEFVLISPDFDIADSCLLLGNEYLVDGCQNLDFIQHCQLNFEHLSIKLNFFDLSIGVMTCCFVEMFCNLNEFGLKSINGKLDIQFEVSHQIFKIEPHLVRFELSTSHSNFLVKISRIFGPCMSLFDTIKFLEKDYPSYEIFKLNLDFPKNLLVYSNFQFKSFKLLGKISISLSDLLLVVSPIIKFQVVSPNFDSFNIFGSLGVDLSSSIGSLLLKFDRLSAHFHQSCLQLFTFFSVMNPIQDLFIINPTVFKILGDVASSDLYLSSKQLLIHVDYLFQVLENFDSFKSSFSPIFQFFENSSPKISTVPNILPKFSVRFNLSEIRVIGKSLDPFNQSNLINRIPCTVSIFGFDAFLNETNVFVQSKKLAFTINNESFGSIQKISVRKSQKSHGSSTIFDLNIANITINVDPRDVLPRSLLFSFLDVPCDIGRKGSFKIFPCHSLSLEALIFDLENVECQNFGNPDSNFQLVKSKNDGAYNVSDLKRLLSSCRIGDVKLPVKIARSVLIDSQYRLEDSNEFSTFLTKWSENFVLFQSNVLLFDFFEPSQVISLPAANSDLLHVIIEPFAIVINHNDCDLDIKGVSVPANGVFKVESSFDPYYKTSENFSENQNLTVTSQKANIQLLSSLKFCIWDHPQILKYLDNVMCHHLLKPIIIENLIPLPIKFLSDVEIDPFSTLTTSNFDHVDVIQTILSLNSGRTVSKDPILINLFTVKVFDNWTVSIPAMIEILHQKPVDFQTFRFKNPSIKISIKPLICASTNDVMVSFLPTSSKMPIWIPELSLPCNCMYVSVPNQYFGKKFNRLSTALVSFSRLTCENFDTQLSLYDTCVADFDMYDLYFNGRKFGCYSVLKGQIHGINEYLAMSLKVCNCQGASHGQIFTIDTATKIPSLGIEPVQANISIGFVNFSIVPYQNLPPLNAKIGVIGVAYDSINNNVDIDIASINARTTDPLLDISQKFSMSLKLTSTLSKSLAKSLTTLNFDPLVSMTSLFCSVDVDAPQVILSLHKSHLTSLLRLRRLIPKNQISRSELDTSKFSVLISSLSISPMLLSTRLGTSLTDVPCESIKVESVSVDHVIHVIKRHVMRASMSAAPKALVSVGYGFGSALMSSFLKRESIEEVEDILEGELNIAKLKPFRDVFQSIVQSNFESNWMSCVVFCAESRIDYVRQDENLKKIEIVSDPDLFCSELTIGNDRFGQLFLKVNK
ncbi:hypothetical protein P9112_009542 [Eukaryota sp. TZLM1-RC]